MKSVGLASISALFLLSLATPWHAAAQTPGAYTAGAYRFLLEDELLKSVDFEVQNDEKGFASGHIAFTDEARIPDVDDPEDPRAEGGAELFIKATVEELTVEGNRALMNGTVVDSSHRTYVGTRIQLVVEDNAENPKLPDRLTWTVCRPQTIGWVPSDAELDRDDGAYMRRGGFLKTSRRSIERAVRGPRRDPRPAAPPEARRPPA